MARIDKLTIGYNPQFSSITFEIESGDDPGAVFEEGHQLIRDLVDIRERKIAGIDEKPMPAVDEDLVKDFKGDPFIIAKKAVGDRTIEGDAYRALCALEKKHGGAIAKIPADVLIKFLIVHGIKGE